MEIATSLRRHAIHSSAALIWRYAKLNIYGLGLLALWDTVTIVLLPHRVEDTVGAGWRGTALGAITLIGIGVAAIVQPFAGRMSDHAPFSDRRRPFVLIGTAVMV